MKLLKSFFSSPSSFLRRLRKFYKPHTRDPLGFAIAIKTPSISFRCQKATTIPVSERRKTIADEMTELERESCRESINLISSSNKVSESGQTERNLRRSLMLINKVIECKRSSDKQSTLGRP